MSTNYLKTKAVLLSNEEDKKSVVTPPLIPDTLDATENGTYTADVGKGFTEVNVNVTEGRLPDISAADNGKILIAENSEWVVDEQKFIANFRKINLNEWDCDKTPLHISVAKSYKKHIYAEIKWEDISSNDYFDSYTYFLIPLVSTTTPPYIFNGTIQTETTTVSVSIIFSEHADIDITVKEYQTLPQLDTNDTVMPVFWGDSWHFEPFAPTYIFKASTDPFDGSIVFDRKIEGGNNVYHNQPLIANLLIKNYNQTDFISAISINISGDTFIWKDNDIDFIMIGKWSQLTSLSQGDTYNGLYLINNLATVTGTMFTGLASSLPSMVNENSFDTFTIPLNPNDPYQALAISLIGHTLTYTVKRGTNTTEVDGTHMPFTFYVKFLDWEIRYGFKVIENGGVYTTADYIQSINFLPTIS